MKRHSRMGQRPKPENQRCPGPGSWTRVRDRGAGGPGRQSLVDRRFESALRRRRSAAGASKPEETRFLSKRENRWSDTGVVPDTVSLSGPEAMKRVRMCPMIELGRCSRETDMGIYVNNVLTGAITHNDEWHVWRLEKACDINCASELRMYTDRLYHLAAFPSLKAARNFVRGPFRRRFLAETETAGTVKAV